MADKDTLNLIKFKFGSFQSIKDLSSKDQSSFYFASDKPAFYNAGLWYGVSSLTSSVNEETGEVTLVINGDFGDNWESSQVKHTFVAGMTTQQKADLEKAVSFVNSVTSTEGEDTQTIIDKWNEIVNFLKGFKDTDVLLERISTIETNVTNLQNTTITGGDGLTGGGNLLKNRTIALGTPSTITDKSINEATGTTHTHAIDEASTEQRGIVRLNDTLTSESTDQALTANQGKVLKEHIDDMIEHIDEMFELIDKGNGVKEIKAKYGLWSDSFISARGVDNESSGVGGLDAQAVWDLLMQNDDATKIINVAHIPDITVAKIADFTTKVGDLIANKADKATTLSGYGIKDALQCIYFKESSLDLNELRHSSVWDGLHPLNRPSNAFGYSSILDLAYQPDLQSQLYFDHYVGTIYRRNNRAGTWMDWSVILDTANASSHVVDLTSAQTITGVKTFSNLRVNNSTLVTNLNAEMVGGVKAENIARQKVGIDINNGDRNYIGYGYGGDGWYSSGGPAICAGVQDYYMMLFGYPNALYYKYEGIGYPDQTWKTVAFTDTNSLTPSGGTLTINGNLTVANQITIGNATLYWDVANQCLRVNAGIASDSFLSAKGIDTTGNGQGGGGGLDATMLWNELTIPSPTNSGKVIDPLFLPMEEIYSPISETFNALEKRVAALEKALTWQTL